MLLSDNESLGLLQALVLGTTGSGEGVKEASAIPWVVEGRIMNFVDSLINEKLDKS